MLKSLSCKYFLITLLLFDGRTSFANPLRKNETKKAEKLAYDEGQSEENPILPDHLDALKLERDGHVNKEFHKEVFLGRHYDKFQNGDYNREDMEAELFDIFKRVDVNGDELLDSEELAEWVLYQTEEHFAEAKTENKKVFANADADGDGKVTWFEFVSLFLAKKGFDRNKVLKKLMDGEKIEISEEDDITIEDLHDKWMQAEPVSPGDYLTEEKFMDFQHPEASEGMLKLLVEDFMHDMDTDDSKDLTVQEYVAMPPDGNVDAVPEDDVWTVQRRNEFRNVIDQNRDGLVDETELEKYLNPQSRPMAEQEARQMIDIGDENGDNKLTWEEILRNSEFFTGSKLFNYANNVHEEF